MKQYLEIFAQYFASFTIITLIGNHILLWAFFINRGLPVNQLQVIVYSMICLISATSFAVFLGLILSRFKMRSAYQRTLMACICLFYACILYINYPLDRPELNPVDNLEVIIDRPANE